MEAATKLQKTIGNLEKLVEQIDEVRGNVELDPEILEEADELADNVKQSTYYIMDFCKTIGNALKLYQKSVQKNKKVVIMKERLIETCKGSSPYALANRVDRIIEQLESVDKKVKVNLEQNKGIFQLILDLVAWPTGIIRQAVGLATTENKDFANQLNQMTEMDADRTFTVEPKAFELVELFDALYQRCTKVFD